MSLETVLRDTRVWRIGQRSLHSLATIPTGFPVLDALLPGGGWPLGALTEILLAPAGSGGLRLVLPALARLSQTEKWLTWIAPPYIPYAPALAAHGLELKRLLIVRNAIAPHMRLWAQEQALRSGACSAVLAWPERIEDRDLRRLQLAAEAGQSWGLLFRPERVRQVPTPAALRIRVEAQGSLLSVDICKCRGGASARSVRLEYA